LLDSGETVEVCESFIAFEEKAIKKESLMRDELER